MDDRPPPPPVPPIPEPLLAPEASEVPWRAREAIPIFLLAFASSVFVSLLLFAAMGVSEGEPSETTFGLLTSIVAEALVGVWVLVWIRMRYRRGPGALGLERRPGDLGAGALAGLAGLAVAYLTTQVVVSIADQVTRGPVRTPEQIPEVAGGLQVGLAILLAVVAAPAAEEILFRGFIYQALRRWKGAAKAALLSAAIFGVSHTDFGGLAAGVRDGDAAEIVSSLLIVAPTLALGIILARIFERRRSLVPPIVAHSLFNAVGVLFILRSS